jgi:hypothetical protein
MKDAASGMLRRVALVGTEVSEHRSTSIIMVIRLGELGTTLAVTSTLGRKIIYYIYYIILIVFLLSARRFLVLFLLKIWLYFQHEQ